MAHSPEQLLHTALKKWDLKLLEEVLVLPAVKQNRKALNAALVNSYFAKKFDFTRQLLEAGADPNHATSIGTLLMCAAMSGQLEFVCQLLDAGAEINREFRRETALSAAMWENQTEVIQYLKNAGATAHPDSVLLVAAKNNDLDAAKKALREGANINAVGGDFSETPLELAARYNNSELVRFLLAKGADVKAKRNAGTVLYTAASHSEDPEILELLVAAGCGVDAGYYDTTPLMAAAQRGAVSIVKKLIELGADIQARDKQHGMSVVDYANWSKNKELISYLRCIGMAAERDGQRTLARVLARQYGGKTVEHSHGFLLNSKISEFKCQFSLSSGEAGVLFHKIKYIDEDLRKFKNYEIVIACQKPKDHPCRLKAVPKIGSELGLTIFRSGKNDSSFDDRLGKFYGRYKQLLARLNLKRDEMLLLRDQSIVFTWSDNTPETILPQLQVVSELLSGICRVPKPASLLFESEWLIKSAGKSGSAGTPHHQLGGSTLSLVRCPHCGDRTNLMARIDLDDPLLPKRDFGITALPAFWCLSCLEWNAAFFDLSGRDAKPITKRKEKLQLPAGEDDLPLLPARLVPVAESKKAGRKSKIGGAPAWIQTDETPDCPSCSNQMTFAYQLSSDSRVAFEDMGMCYVFVCTECKVSASLVQSH